MSDAHLTTHPCSSPKTQSTMINLRFRKAVHLGQYNPGGNSQGLFFHVLVPKQAVILPSYI
jgi:hypothetical protein